jgi:hypothetical protein
MTDEVKTNSFKYTDRPAATGDYSYRLRLIGTKGETEYSRVVSFRMKDAPNTEMRVFPSAVTSSVTVNLNAQANESVVLRVSDMNGRIMKQQQVNLQKGNNNITATGFEKFTRGNYVISVNTAQGMQSKQITVL